MKNMTALKIIAAVVMAVSASVVATAADEPDVTKDVQVLPSISIRAAGEETRFGTSAALVWAERGMDVSANQRWINVNQNEVVKFSAEGKTFAWRFDTHESAFPFAEIAPAEFGFRTARVFVGPDMKYPGGE